jgi:peptidase M50-like protein
MHQLRKYLSWIFTLSFLVCLQIALSGISGIIHRHLFILRFRILLVPALFSILAATYGIACWAIWKGKRSARGWGIAASVTYILLPLSIFFFIRHSILRHFQVMLAIGIAGLIAFASGYDPRDLVANSHKNQKSPGDGTSDLLNKSAPFLGIALVFGALVFVGRWIRSKGISETHGFWYGNAWIVLIILIITTLHELGHTATGLFLGMKLRAFAVGPFQWQVRGGKWNFQFRLTGFLSGGGATGVVPATVDFPRSHYLAMIAAGPLVTLLTGIIALRVAPAAEANVSVEAGGHLALFGALSLAGCAFNLLPFKTGYDYSDGASIYQLLSRGPWSDFQRVVAVIGSSLVTPLRPRDYDIEAIQQLAQAITEGKQGLLLRLFAYLCFLDQGKTFEAGQALTEAEAIYHRCASDIPAELHTEFVFGNAYVRRDTASARDWWNRMEAKKPTRLNEDYWRAYSALHWIEGHLKEANEAWDKCNILAEQLPKVGAYEFDRYCCSLLRKALDEVSVAEN